MRFIALLLLAACSSASSSPYSVAPGDPNDTSYCLVETDSGPPKRLDCSDVWQTFTFDLPTVGSKIGCNDGPVHCPQTAVSCTRSGNQYLPAMIGVCVQP